MPERWCNANVSLGCHDPADLDLSGITPLRTADDETWAWTNTADVSELALRWHSVGELGEGTLGRGVHDFHLARGFQFPGEPGSAPLLLAQHDWVHVIADHGTSSTPNSKWSPSLPGPVTTPRRSRFERRY